VPAVATSFVEVTEAQRLRGWRPRGPRSWMEVVVPVVLTSVEGSIQLAESMEARGFGSGARTTMAAHALRRSDWLLVAASGLALAGFAAARATGWAADWFAYPSLTFPTIHPGPIAACLLLFTPVLVWRSRR
jgi:energy-coupling factor transport system permease protein